MKPRISIIIPVYNVKKYLEQCLKSVVVETELKKIEVLVIDDGSSDCSGKIVDFNTEKYPYCPLFWKHFTTAGHKYYSSGNYFA